MFLRLEQSLQDGSRAFVSRADVDVRYRSYRTTDVCLDKRVGVADSIPIRVALTYILYSIDTVDSQLADSWRMSIMTVANCIGSVIIITVFLHYFIAVVFAVGVGYAYL